MMIDMGSCGIRRCDTLLIGFRPTAEAGAVQAGLLSTHQVTNPSDPSPSKSGEYSNPNVVYSAFGASIYAFSGIFDTPDTAS